MFNSRSNYFQNNVNFPPQNKNFNEFLKKNNINMKLSYYNSSADIKLDIAKFDFFVTIEGIDLLKSIVKSFNDAKQKFTQEEIIGLIKKD